MAVRKSKYSEILRDVEQTFGVEPDYQAKVDLVKQSILTNTPRTSSALLQKYFEARNDRDRVQIALYDANLRLEAVQQLLIRQMEADNISSIRLAAGLGVSTWNEPLAQVRDPEAFRLWCLEQGLERKMTLHPSSIQSLVRKRLEAAEEEPPGIVIYSKPVIRLA
jgi:hypothetical protein